MSCSVASSVVVVCFVVDCLLLPSAHSKCSYFSVGAAATEENGHSDLIHSSISQLLERTEVVVVASCRKPNNQQRQRWTWLTNPCSINPQTRLSGALQSKMEGKNSRACRFHHPFQGSEKAGSTSPSLANSKVVDCRTETGKQRTTSCRRSFPAASVALPTWLADGLPVNAWSNAYHPE